MASNNDSLNESILIRRAKRRLAGALTILIILFVLSVFFLQDRSEQKKINEEVKVSFMEMHEYEIDKSPKIIPNKNKQKLISQNTVLTENEYLIQLGIFNDEKNAKKLLDAIQELGLKGQFESVIFGGEKKIKLVTESFNNRNDASNALVRIKNAQLPGILKVKKINDNY